MDRGDPRPDVSRGFLIGFGEVWAETIVQTRSTNYLGGTRDPFRSTGLVLQSRLHHKSALTNSPSPMSYPMSRNSARAGNRSSWPDFGRIVVRRASKSASGGPKAGRRADVEALPIRIWLGRNPARKPDFWSGAIAWSPFGRHFILRISVLTRTP